MRMWSNMAWAGCMWMPAEYHMIKDMMMQQEEELVDFRKEVILVANLQDIYQIVHY